MALICARCKSPATQAGLDKFHCLDCGAETRSGTHEVVEGDQDDA